MVKARLTWDNARYKKLDYKKINFKNILKIFLFIEKALDQKMMSVNLNGKELSWNLKLKESEKVETNQYL